VYESSSGRGGVVSTFQKKYPVTQVITVIVTTIMMSAVVFII